MDGIRMDGVEEKVSIGASLSDPSVGQKAGIIVREVSGFDEF